jgi:hypothetical protein
MAHYRVRVIPGRLAFEKTIIDANGRARMIGSGQVATPDEAANEAALAILADHLRGDFPRVAPGRRLRARVSVR